MKVGLVGMPGAGKSTLFRLLTGAAPPGGDRRKAPLGSARVPDSRVDRLAEMYRPQKVTYASIAVTEIPGFVPSSLAGHGVKGLDPKGFVDSLRDVDALVYVVRAFDDPAVPQLREAPAPADDLSDLAAELILADWQLVETRLERLKETRKKRPTHEAEVAVLSKAAGLLEAGTPLYAAGFTPEELALLTGYTFFTQKPAIVAVNLDEEQLRSGAFPQKDELLDRAGRVSAPVVEFAAQVEAEIAELDPQDRALFMEDLGLSEPGVARLAQAAYARLGLISYFTVGEDEVRAWTVRRGANAQEAAGAIHSDIARGFIRAEVASYGELIEAGGWAALQKMGRVRLEGRDYIVEDGDIMSFRFNV